MRLKAFLPLILPLWILTGCDQGFKVEDYKWSPNGEHISIASKNKIIFLEAFSPYAIEDSTIEKTSSPFHSWSPLSSKLVYTTDQNGGWDLVLVDIGSKEEFFLTQDMAKDFYPRYLNSEEILFYSDRNGKISPWRYLISSKQFVQDLDPISPLPNEGESWDGLSQITLTHNRAGCLIYGNYKTKKWWKREYSLELKSPRWSHDNIRCAFVAHNPKIMKDEFLLVVNFEDKTTEWVPLLPAHYLLFADYFSKHGEWIQARHFDQEFLKRYPDDENGNGAYLRQAYYHLHLKPDFDQVERILATMVQKFPQSKGVYEAQFWLAVTSGLKKDWERAKNRFQSVKSIHEEGKYAEEIEDFLKLFSIKNTPKKIMHDYFEAFRLKEGKDHELAIQKYTQIIDSSGNNQLGLASRKNLAMLYQAKGESEKALKLWDEAFSRSENLELKEKARYESAFLLQSKLNKPKKALQIYRKVGVPFHHLALKQMFYLNRDVLFDFNESERIGNAFIKDYPLSESWDKIYEDLDKLKRYIRRSIPEKELNTFYKAAELERQNKWDQAFSKYKKATLGAKDPLFQKELYSKMTHIAQDSLADPKRTLETTLSYASILKSREDLEESDIRMAQQVLLPAVELLKEGRGKELVSLAKGHDCVWANAVEALGFYSQEKWEESAQAFKEFIDQYRPRSGEKDESEQLTGFFNFLAATALEQLGDWDQALHYMNQPFSADWSEAVRTHRDWIQQFRLTDETGLKTVLLAHTYSLSEIKLIFGEKNSEEMLKDFVFRHESSPVTPMAILHLSEILIQRAQSESKNHPTIRETLYRLKSLMNRLASGSDLDGEMGLKCASFEQLDAFYVLAVNGYEDVSEQFSTTPLADKALWLKANLYMEKLNDQEEGVKILNTLIEKNSENEWFRKANIKLARLKMKNSDQAKEVVSHLNNVIDAAPNSPEAHEALIELGDFYFDSLNQYGKALTVYERLLSKNTQMNNNEIIQNRVWLLKAGNKAVHLWKQVHQLDPAGEGEKGNKIYQKLLRKSQSEPFQILILNQWASFAHSAQTNETLPHIYQQRVQFKMDQKDWDEILSSVKNEVNKGHFIPKWGSLLASWSTIDGVPAEVKYKMTFLKAKALIKEKKYSKATTILKSLLKQLSLSKEVLREYWLTQKKLSQSGSQP